MEPVLQVGGMELQAGAMAQAHRHRVSERVSERVRSSSEHCSIKTL